MAYSISCVICPNADPVIFTAELSKIGFNSVAYYNKVIELDKTRRYLIGIDQSPNCTGISLATDNFDSIFIFTIPIDDKSASKYQRYFPVLEEFLYQMLDGIDLRYLVYENVPPIGYRNQKILHEMKGIVEGWFPKISAISAMDSDYWFCPYPNEWKSFVYDKKDSGAHRKNAFRSKKEISRDITKKMPILTKYFEVLNQMSGHDYDGMDAFGMMLAARFLYFTPDWDLINKKMSVQISKFYVVFKYLSADQIKLSENWEELQPGHMFWGLVDFIKLDKVVNREWNPKYSIYQNYVMAANTDKIVIMECVDIRHIFAILIESEATYDANKTLFCYVFKTTGKSGVTESVAGVIGDNSTLMKVFY